MCGIAGIIANGENERKLASMLHAQKHRGPDATGIFIDENFAALGHNRLSIIDLSDEANQPFFDFENRYAMVFNGEIYNYLELRARLSGNYDFRTKSDTEVLLAAYLTWGKECLHEFNGMFSFAIWDKAEKTLFAARDRFGVKPFHYARTESGFCFASEIKALHAFGIDRKPNEKVWASYFVHGTYGNPDETFWQGVSQLPGAHFLEYKNGELSVSQWYSFVDAVAKQPQNLSYDEVRERYTDLLKDSIALRFRADVPVGFNISGGLDSSVLLSMVNEVNRDAANISAYTFYTGNPDYDELPWVEMMIGKTGNPLCEVLLSANEIAKLSDKIHWHEDEPFGGIPTLAYAKIFETARRDGTIVLLDGQGMDEQWAGYDYYTKGEGTIQGVSESPYRWNVLSEEFIAKAEKPKYPKPFEDDLLNKQYRDIFYTKIPRALRFNDRISMAASTELREPFLDYRLMEFAFSQPFDFKIRNGVTKAMLRDIASEYLADDLVFAPKRPLQTPQREWLADELRDLVNDAIAKLSQNPQWFDAEKLEAEWQKYLDGDNQSSFHVWQWISAAKLL